MHKNILNLSVKRISDLYDCIIFNSSNSKIALSFTFSSWEEEKYLYVILLPIWISQAPRLSWSQLNFPY